MGGIAREQIAKYRVFGIGRAASYDVARVEVTHHDRNVSRFKPLFNLLVQKETDVLQLDVSGSVALVSSAGQKFLTRTFSDSNDCVPAVENTTFQRGEKSAFAFQLEWHFGNEREVHILARHRGLGS